MNALAVEAHLQVGHSWAVTPAQRVGFWAATTAALASGAFTVGAALGMLGLVGPPWDAVASLGPSLLLAPSFLTMLVCLHYSVPPGKRIFSHVVVLLAGIYAALCSTAYVVELTIVEPLILRGQADQAALLTLSRYGSLPSTVLTAIDGLGYGFMSLACLFAAAALGDGQLQRWTRTLFVAVGLLGVPSLLTYFVNPAWIYVAAPWGIVVPVLCTLVGISFRRRLAANCPVG